MLSPTLNFHNNDACNYFSKVNAQRSGRKYFCANQSKLRSCCDYCTNRIEFKEEFCSLEMGLAISIIIKR